MEDKKLVVTMRTPVPDHLINQLPKPTAAQTADVKADYKAGIRCTICGGWHHPKVVHLSYFGHAALTDRMLDVDPSWNWEPLALDSSGLPAIDKDGGMWIKLTVLGMTRLGYGDAQGKTGADAMKERIGDALRNAAMRFGTALELWFKGDLHKEVEEVAEVVKITDKQKVDILALAQELDVKMPAFLKYLRLSKIDDLPSADYLEAIKAIEKKRATKTQEQL